MNRRQILGVGLSAATAAALPFLAPQWLAPAHAEDAEIFSDDRILGSKDAPITIIEYSSLTCPHCAEFHKSTLPMLKRDWIDEGKVRLILRHFPLDGLALRAALVANCLEGDRHFSFVDVLYANQQRWARAEHPLAELARLSKLAGLSQESFDKCVSDRQEMDRIIARAKAGEADFSIRSTPTFVINGRKVEGAINVEKFEEVLKELTS